MRETPTVKQEPEKLAEVIPLTMARLRPQQRADAKAAFGLPDPGPLYDPRRVVCSVGIPAEKRTEIEQRVDRLGRPIRALAHDHELWAHLQAGQRTILLLGTYGTGKTLTACRWLAQRHMGRYLYAARIAALTDYSEDREQRAAWVGERWQVVDEVCDVDRHRERLTSYLVERHDAGRTTVLVANHYTLEQKLKRRMVVVECLEVVDPRARQG